MGPVTLFPPVPVHSPQSGRRLVSCPTRVTGREPPRPTILCRRHRRRRLPSPTTSRVGSPTTGSLSPTPIRQFGVRRDGSGPFGVGESGLFVPQLLPIDPPFQSRVVSELDPGRGNRSRGSSHSVPFVPTVLIDDFVGSLDTSQRSRRGLLFEPDPRSEVSTLSLPPTLGFIGLPGCDRSTSGHDGPCQVHEYDEVRDTQTSSV